MKPSIRCAWTAEGNIEAITPINPGKCSLFQSSLLIVDLGMLFKVMFRKAQICSVGLFTEAREPHGRIIKNIKGRGY